jgi:hypothetical protein
MSLFLMAVITTRRPLAEQVVTIGAVFMSPLFAEPLDLPWRFGGHHHPVLRDGNVLVTDETFAHPFGLVCLMVENHAILEPYDIGGVRSGRDEKYRQ